MPTWASKRRSGASIGISRRVLVVLYGKSLSQVRYADVANSALADYFVDFHQRVVASDN
jgi:hypothetical protein